MSFYDDCDVSVLFPSCLPAYCFQWFYVAIFSSNEPINKSTSQNFSISAPLLKISNLGHGARLSRKKTNLLITCVSLIRRALTTWTHSSPCQCRTTARRSLRVVTCTTQTATGCSIHRVRINTLNTWITA